MHKSKAIELLGGTIAAAAEAVGCSYQAVNQWPDELPARIADRVLAAQARKHLPPELIGATPAETPAGQEATPARFVRANGEVVPDERVASIPVIEVGGLTVEERRGTDKAADASGSK
jgi:hypothetical protein